MSNKDIINELYNIILERKESPLEGSYTNYLFEKGIDKVLKKVGEECSEVIIACKNRNKPEIVNEVSDLVYHLLVMMALENITIADVEEELVRRRDKIGNKKPERTGGNGLV